MAEEHILRHVDIVLENDKKIRSALGEYVEIIREFDVPVGRKRIPAQDLQKVLPDIGILTAQVAELQATVEERNKTIEEKDQEIATKDAEIERLKKENEELKREPAPLPLPEEV